MIRIIRIENDFEFRMVRMVKMIINGRFSSGGPKRTTCAVPAAARAPALVSGQMILK